MARFYSYENIALQVVMELILRLPFATRGNQCLRASQR
jgi:hypothetical protein